MGLRAGTVARPVDLPEEEPGAWDLVHAAQEGDTAAFGVLYDRYVDVVYRYVLFRLGNRELAEDITSETFLRALRRITTVTYQGRDVGAWFITIARNIVLDHVKSSRYKLEIVTDEVSESGSAPFAGQTVVEEGPEQAALSNATREVLFRCIGDLGDDQRECIVLRFIQGLSLTETAEIMKRNEGAVKALQHRAVRKLASLLPDAWRY
ncbi:MAG TPA: sigma-70 family RNA polymerase sigma factor [Amycolatopsis sp.]|nr:sigma-70 family RNA polymerase sigma factor [Amycolatopsis sp.]